MLPPLPKLEDFPLGLSRLDKYHIALAEYYKATSEHMFKALETIVARKGVMAVTHATRTLRAVRKSASDVDTAVPMDNRPFTIEQWNALNDVIRSRYLELSGYSFDTDAFNKAHMVLVKSK